MKHRILTTAALALAIITAGAQGQKDMRQFIDDLMGRMTLEEKIGQLNLQVAGDITTGEAQDTQVGGLIAQGKMGGVFNLKGVDKIRALQDIAVRQSRLGIPLLVGMDVIHGYETIFPIPLALACSWDLEAIETMARISAREASADGINWVFSPMVDIALDARWGRVAEGAGEDPYLGSQVARAYIRGYQQSQPSTVNSHLSPVNSHLSPVNSPLGSAASLREELSPVNSQLSPQSVMACVKHYALYGAVESGRDYNTVDMSHLRMYNQYFPPYRAAAEEGAGSFMSSFNLVDGQHATANRWLLTDVLRHQWQWDGFVVTDYGSIGEMTAHGFGDLKRNSARALHAGTDMDMCAQGFLQTLQASAADGTVSLADIDQACRRVLEAKYKLGLFDDPYRYLDPKRRQRDIFTKENRAEARRIATETFVLLKNDAQVLPLKKQSTVALIGPLANDRANMSGTWVVAATPERYTTLKGAMEKVKGCKVLYAQGCNLTRSEALQRAAEFGKNMPRGDEQQLRAEALDVARRADVIVCAMGECADFSGESSSRAQLDMPDVQRELLAELVTLGKPVVLLNFSGRPTVLTWEQEHLDAILNVWFAGSETGEAICDVLFGDVAPSGRLVNTFPKAVGQLPIYYNHLPTGRGVPDGATEYHKFQSNYLDVLGGPLYPFGYGLSYTTFSYSDITLQGATATVTVTNTGSREADEVVQLYIRQPVCSISRPVKELKGFQRIRLKAGESRRISFSVTRQMLSYFDAYGQEVFEPGTFQIMIGPNSRDVKTAELTMQ